MRPLSKKDRELLSARRICDVNEPWIDDILPTIPHKGRRVLVPARLREHFADITAHGGEIRDMPACKLHEIVVKLARQKVGAYYRATAPRTLAPKGYSCSTLTYWVFTFIGIHLPRYAIDQSRIGKPVKNPVHGGLVFYENSYPIRDRDRAIGHVGITTNGGNVIHGSATTNSKVAEQPTQYGAILFTNPYPVDPQILIHLPPKIQDTETALDLARCLERLPRF